MRVTMSTYASETRTEQLDEGRWRGHVHAAWNIGDNPNGGYLLSIVLCALREALPHPDPISITTHFLRPGEANADCEIDIDVVRTGRSVSTARAELRQSGKTKLVVLAAFGNLAEPVGIADEFVPEAPSRPDFDACVPRSGALQGIELAINERIDLRLNPALVTAGGGQAAIMEGYVRLSDETDPDTTIACLFMDVFPPSPFARLGVVGWVPTIELTVHVRRRPASGWMFARLACEDLSGGRMIESGMLWDSSGALIAQSRQLGLVMQGGSS